MRKKNGFLLTELLISFSLSFIILLVIFNTTISLSQKLSDLFVENRAYSQQIVFNRKIADDMAFNKISSIKESVDGNKRTVEILYDNGVRKSLIIDSDRDEPSITYGKEKVKLADDNMKIKNQNTLSCTAINGKYLVKIKVPIYNKKETKDYGIEIYDIADTYVCPKNTYQEELLSQKIKLDNPTIYEKPTFSTTSTDKGLFVQKGDSSKSIDGKATYYYRGAVENNYVSFGTYQTTGGGNTIGEPIIWRILRINEDGTIRLISQNTIATSAWNSKNSIKYINDDGTDSTIKTSVENWYAANIGNNATLNNKVVQSSFCNDITGINFNITSGSSWGTAYYRIRDNKPIFTCPNGSIVANEKVGLITGDELVYAGGLHSAVVSGNTTFLNNNTHFWTLTPWSINSEGNNYIQRWDVNSLYIWNIASHNAATSVRAVINLDADIAIAGGDGTKDNPYTISYRDDSGANKPELAEGLIPVIYDDTNDVWKKATINEKWYDYEEQWWANAVTVTSTNRSKYMSDNYIGEIPMSDINSMWVWIPRYKYNIPSNIGSSSNVTSPPQINVVFESGTKATGVTETVYRTGIASDGTNANYYTHPAFRNVSNITYDSSTTSRGAWDEEITGLWAAKFETGTTNSTCNTSPSDANCKNVEPIIKPDVISLRYQNVSTQFLHSLKFAGGTMNSSTGKVTFSGSNTYGLTSSTDTHMMKNTEWGAIAILSQSKYGKMGNSDYSGTNKEIYKNNSSGYYTGRSSGVPPASGSTTYGTYSYNDKACSAATCTGSKTINKGTGASTTGTIYGVYDMSGGASDTTMANWNNYSGESATVNSGFSGTNGNGTTTTGISFPESKYYDLYKGTNSYSLTKEKAILGDAIWENLRWYSDNMATMIYSTFPWGYRGGYLSHGTGAGIFYSYPYRSTDGVGWLSWHAILIP